LAAGSCRLRRSALERYAASGKKSFVRQLLGKYTHVYMDSQPLSGRFNRHRTCAKLLSTEEIPTIFDVVDDYFYGLS
jgi:hypothetical protein